MRRASFLSNRFLKTSSNPYRKKNLRAFVICLLISVIAWGFIKISKNYEVDFQVPLVFYNARETEVISSQSHQLVTYRLRASGVKTILNRIRPRVDTLFLDTRQGPRVTRDNNLWVYFTENQLKSAISEFFPTDHYILQLSPDTVFALLDKAIEKKVPVRVISELDFQKGFGLVGSIVSTPDSVLVKGPRNIVESLTEIDTRLLQLQNLSAVANINAQLVNPAKSSGLELSATNVQLSISVEEFTEASFNIPVIVRYGQGFEGDLPNLRLFPERVNVVCLVPLRHFSSLNQTHLEAFVLLSDKDFEEATLEVFVEVSFDDVKIASVTPLLVECIIMEE